MKLAARVAQHVVFRAAIAALFLAIHMGAMVRYASTRFGVPFNNAPGEPPTFTSADFTTGADNWNRLIVSRWDSGQYIAMALDGIYGHCPKADLRGADLADLNTTCDLPFFPAYAAIGWVASYGTRYAVDYALLGVSLLASFLLLFLWTGPVVVRALGLWGTYCALLLFNVYTTGFTLVTVLTEPCTLLFTFGAFVCLEKKRVIPAVLLAGAASAMRVSGVCASAGLVAALLLEAWDKEELTAKEWVALGCLAPLSAWGILAMMSFDWWRFHDPFVYAHAHAQSFVHDPRLWHVFWPNADWVVKSMGSGVHDVGIAAIMALWFALGHRQGLQGFSRPTQAFLYVHTVIGFVLPLYGSAELAYAGVTRYLFLAIGVFFAMAGVLRRRPLALAVWCVISGWHYWNADLCYYLSFGHPLGMAQCLADPTAEAPPPPPATPGHIDPGSLDGLRLKMPTPPP